MWKAYPFLNLRDTQHKPLVGISACLCGDLVRYDGRSKGQPELIEAIANQLQLYKICPEVAIGMGVPRPPMQLCNDSGSVQAVGVENPQHNVTQALQDYASELIDNPSFATDVKTPLCGYILKSRSPSCGVGSTPIHHNNTPVRLGDGIFAQQIKHQQPWLPVAQEEGLLNAENLMRFLLLVYLADDFFHCATNNDGLGKFHLQHAELWQMLPMPVQHQLDRMVSTSLSSFLAEGHSGPAFTDYLTLLVNALQRLPYQQLKTLIPA